MPTPSIRFKELEELFQSYKDKLSELDTYGYYHCDIDEVELVESLNSFISGFIPAWKYNPNNGMLVEPGEVGTYMGMRVFYKANLK